MSTINSCPFCGSPVKDGWTTSPYWFMCGTMTNEEVNRNDQTTQCVEAEVGALKRHITQLENDVLSTKWVWMMNYCKTHRVSPTLGWESAEKAWRKAKEAKL